MADLARRIAAFDRAALLGLTARRRRPLVALFWTLTWSGAAPTWIGLSALLFAWATLRPDHRLAAATLVAAAAASGSIAILSTIVKQLVRRPRPWMTLPELLPVSPPRERWSFPSSHAGTSFAFATVLVVIGHPLAPIAAVWAALTAYSRLYLTLHYPSDVAGGALLGVAWGAVFGLWAWAPLTAWLVAAARSLAG